MNKNRILNIIPYMIGIIYLTYCMFNVEMWVKSHTEEYLLFAAAAWFVAVILAVVFLVLRLIRKHNLKMFLPIFYFIIGLIIYVVAQNIPCCPVG